MRRCNFFSFKKSKFVKYGRIGNRSAIRSRDSNPGALMQTMKHTVMIVCINSGAGATIFTLKTSRFVKQSPNRQSIADSESTEPNSDTRLRISLDNLILCPQPKFQEVRLRIKSFTCFKRFHSILKGRISTRIVGYFGTGKTYRKIAWNTFKHSSPAHFVKISAGLVHSFSFSTFLKNPHT